jgi:hypothetical protein
VRGTTIMTIPHRCVLILVCLIAPSLTCGCSSDASTTPRMPEAGATAYNSVSPPSPDRQLLEVAGSSAFKEEPDDPVAAMALLDAGANVNARDSASVPVLTVAVRSGRIKVAEALLARGADVNTQDDRGQTALMVAAGFSDPKMVRLLLDHKADVNVKDGSGFTALSGSEIVGGSSDPDYLSVRRMLRKAGAK